MRSNNPQEQIKIHEQSAALAREAQIQAEAARDHIAARLATADVDKHLDAANAIRDLEKWRA
ncbi:hypothetical protein [Streptomyces sp. 1-11]|uniref:hypothetical protein n=1 Tax=Streptomyces sp. 1-11 TaxID=2590549 RepID=UPI001168A733|nr:hypothetical protein [Streptomyces sp. 1-11]GEK03493.1 hypothetical protein TNCT1_57690 [Streptomyces sp. 1-11]